jgi:DNA polymerase III subunit delta
VARGVASVIEAARASDADAVVTEFVAGDMTESDLLGAVSPALFGGLRVVVLRDSQDAKKELATALFSYVQQPEPDIVLVVTHAGGAKGKAIVDGLREAGAEVTSAGKISRHRDRVEFVRAEIRRLGGKCPEDAAEALLAAVGNDLREVAAACSQLVADTDGRIDAATVARYYRGRAEANGFTVADAVMVGDLPAALEALRWALHVGVDPVPIAAALADGVRVVARVGSAGRGSAYQMAGNLGLPPWKVERAQRQAKGWTAEGLADAMLAAVECDAAVKGGSEDRGYALERAVFGMVAARGVGPSGRGSGAG